MKQAVLTTTNLAIGYAKSKGKKIDSIQENLNISLNAGELTCLLGINGVGKSTLLRTLSNMQLPLRGDILLYNKNLKTYSETDLSTLLGLVLTDKTAIGGFSVREVVGLGRYPYTGFFGKLGEKDKAIVDKAMDEVSINHKANNYLAELSDGEKQKVMIAKALAQECPVIILDEPTAFLDVINRFEIITLLHKLAIEQNKAILLSTHDMELAFTLADRLWVMGKNKPLKTGITEDIVLSDTIDRYIGNPNISFDNKSGRFVSQNKKERTVYLQANSDAMQYWMKNFVEKKGYGISDIEDKSLFTINIANPSDIRLSGKNIEEENFNSFDELSSFLDNLKH